MEKIIEGGVFLFCLAYLMQHANITAGIVYIALVFGLVRASDLPFFLQSIFLAPVAALIGIVLEPYIESMFSRNGKTQAEEEIKNKSLVECIDSSRITNSSEKVYEQSYAKDSRNAVTSNDNESDIKGSQNTRNPDNSTNNGGGHILKTRANASNQKIDFCPYCRKKNVVLSGCVVHTCINCGGVFSPDTADSFKSVTFTVLPPASSAPPIPAPSPVVPQEANIAQATPKPSSKHVEANKIFACPTCKVHFTLSEAGVDENGFLRCPACEQLINYIFD